MKAGYAGLAPALPVYLAVFAAFLDTHAQLPVLAPYAFSLGAGPFLAGLAVGAYSLSNIAGNLASGPVIDSRGAKGPLVGGLLGAGAVLMLYPMAPGPWPLVGLRLIHGLAGGMLVPSALVWLSQTGHPGDRFSSRPMSRFGMAVSLAALSGPLAAGLTAQHWGPAAVFPGLAALMLAAALLSRGLPKVSPTWRDRVAPIPVGALWTHPALQHSFALAFAVMGSMGVLAAFLPSRAGEAGLGPAGTGFLFAGFSALAVAVHWAWPRLLAQTGQPRWACLAGTATMALGLALVPFLQQPPVLAAGVAVLGAGFGLCFQGMLALLLGNSAPVARGRGAGLFFAFYSLGVGVVPPLAGWLWETTLQVQPFYTAAILMAAVHWRTIRLPALKNQVEP